MNRRKERKGRDRKGRELGLKGRKDRQRERTGSREGKETSIFGPTHRILNLPLFLTIMC